MCSTDTRERFSWELLILKGWETDDSTGKLACLIKFGDLASQRLRSYFGDSHSGIQVDCRNTLQRALRCDVAFVIHTQ